ncbi:hypothetical protein JTB14_021631 [Gonioctena quinquepunctata]|nr:hypothetical protein JTB14_021631 [Gonioctena quinquepunctata]
MHTTQIFGTISHGQSLNPLQTISNTPDATPRTLLIDKHSNPIGIIPLLVPNPPISDDTDTDKKLVPYSDCDSDSLTKINKSKKRKKRFEVDEKEWILKKANKEEKKVKDILRKKKKKTVGLTLNQKEHVSLNQDAPVRLGSTILLYVKQ